MDNKLSELKAAALAATPGPWGIDRAGNTIVSNQSHPVATISDAFHRQLASGGVGNDAEFIAAANPAVVLALLAELEAKDGEIAEANARVDVMCAKAMNLTERAESAEKQLATCHLPVTALMPPLIIAPMLYAPLVSKSRWMINMASNEILTVERIGRADGEWGCMCPHCGKPIFFSEDDINDVRGSQYQHNGRTSWRTDERCEGWLEVSSDAKYSRIMFDQGDA